MQTFYNDVQKTTETKQGIQRRMVLVVILFVFSQMKCFCFVAAMNNRMHGVEAIFHLPMLLKASGNNFLKCKSHIATTKQKHNKCKISRKK